MSGKTREQVIADSWTMLEAMAIKIVRQRWLLDGIQPTPLLIEDAKNRIKAEIKPFLEDVASWALKLHDHKLGVEARRPHEGP